MALLVLSSDFLRPCFQPHCLPVGTSDVGSQLWASRGQEDRAYEWPWSGCMLMKLKLSKWHHSHFAYNLDACVLKSSHWILLHRMQVLTVQGLEGFFNASSILNIGWPNFWDPQSSLWTKICKLHGETHTGFCFMFAIHQPDYLCSCWYKELKHKSLTHKH